jgi:hypothetical protein
MSGFDESVEKWVAYLNDLTTQMMPDTAVDGALMNMISLTGTSRDGRSDEQLRAAISTGKRFTKIDPSKIVVSFGGVQITGFGAGSFIVDDPINESWEECGPEELTKGDVVTHRQDQTINPTWEPVGWFGEKCGGWLIEESSDTHVRGYRLAADGKTIDSSLQDIMSLDWAVRLRVIPWDAAPAVQADPSRWNGTCPKCGKGTYTGFSSVDHDGPCS